jgi:ricin-type beta-trefoil lectin protein
MTATTRRLLTACSIVLLLALSVNTAAAVAGTAEEIDVLPTVDQLNRSESPLSGGGKWTTLNWATGTGWDTTAGWGPSSAFPAVNGAYWNLSPVDGRYGNAAAPTMQASPGASAAYVSLWLNMPSPGAAKSGYQLRWTLNSDLTTYTVKLSKWVAGAEAVLATNPSVSIPAGTTLAIADTGTGVSAWRRQNGVLSSLLSVNDTTYASGYAGIEGSGNISRSLGFRAGPLLGTAASGTPLLDNLERAEVPLATGKWTKTSWASQIGGAWMGSYRGYGSSGGLAGAFWNQASFSDGGGAAISAATVGTGATPAGQYLGLWLNMPNPGSVRSGYEARFTGTNNTATAYTVELSKWAAGTRTVLASKTGYSLPVGTTMALTESAGSVVLWTGAGNALTPLLSSADTTYPTGYAGLEVNGGAGTVYNFRAGDFGAGVDTVAPNTTVSAGPSGSVLAQSVSFYFASSENNSTFECALDEGAYAACASPKAYPSLGFGRHTFRVRAIDGARNIDPTPVERTFAVIAPPTVTMADAIEIKSTRAVLGAVVNPNNSATAYQFEWGASASYGNTAPAIAQAIGSGTRPVEVGEPISGLAPNTEYHFRLSATNEIGTTKGADRTFLTPDAPQATTDVATDIRADAATLGAIVNPHGAATTYYFEYGRTTAYGNKAPLTPKSAGAGRAEVNVGETASGLSEGTEYHFRVVARNEVGTVYGSDESFTTPLLPDAETAGANEVTANEAVLMATVDPNGEPTSYRFQYGKTTAYGNTVPAVSEEKETGDQPVEAEEGVAFLEPETTYHYRVVATSGAGTVFGPDQTLVTSARTETPTQEAQRAQAEATGVPVPNDFVNVHWSGDTPRFATEAVMEMVRGSGAKMLRMGVGRRSETFDWIFRRAANKGITLLPGLGGGRMENENSAGIRPAWRDFVRDVVKAYGRGGEFWQTVDPGSRRAPQYWEIWNEENYGNNGDGDGNPNPAAYGDVLEEAASVIHEVDSQAKILVGGLLTVGKKGDVPKMGVGEFIRKMGHHGAYDALGLHPYVFKDDEGDAPTDAGDVKEVTEAVRRNIQEARAALNDKGGSEKKIWVNEIGWPVKGPITPNDGSHVPVSEDIQRDLLNSTFNMIKANHGADRFNIENVFYYNTQDYEENDPAWDHYSWDYRSGLREELRPYEEGRYRKSWYAFQDQAGFTGTYPKPARNDHELRNERPRKLTEYTKMNAYGSPTDYWVKWGPGWNSNSYGNFTTAQNFGDRVEEADVTKESVVAGLQPDTKYHYAVVSENDAGQKTETADMEFKTPPSSSTSNNIERVLDGQPGWLWVEGWVKEGDIEGSLPGLSNVHVHVKLFRNGQFERLVDVMTDGNGHYESGYIQVGKGDWETRTDFPGGGDWDASSSSTKTFKVRDGVLIKARHSDNCMDVEGGWFANGVRVMHGSCHGEANQVFSLRPKGSGEYLEIVARHSGKCLDVGWASQNDGEQIVQHDCNGGSNQAFREAWWADTPYTSYVAQHSGKCLDVTGGSMGWAPIQQWSCNGALQQRFRLVPVESGPIPTETSVEIDQVLHGSPGSISFHGYLKAGPYSMANRVVQVEFDNAAAGGWSTMFSAPATVNSGGYYEWRDYGLSPGYYNIRAHFVGNSEFKESFSPGTHNRTVKRGYQIVNRYSGKCLSLSENRNVNGQRFLQWDCGGAVNGNGQIFSFWEPQGDGWYQIRTNGTNRCLDVINVSGSDGAGLQLWDCLGGGQTNQHWRREPLASQPGWFGLMPRHVFPNKCMDVLGWGTNNGALVAQWQCHWGANQQWDLRGVIDP